MDSQQLHLLQQLLENQRQYWQNLSQQQDWSTAFGFKQSDQAQAQHTAMAGMMSEQAKAYSDMAQALVEKLQQQANSSDSKAFIQLFTEQFQQYRQRMLFAEMDLAPAIQEMLASLRLGDSFAGGFPFMQAQWGHLLERLKQRFSNTEKSYCEFQQCYLTFMQLEQQLNLEVNQRLHALFEEQQPDNLQQVFDCWVEEYEKTYEQHILTSEYQQAYHDLIKTSVQLQQLNQESWVEEYRLFGLVPTQDYDDLLAKHHQLQKRSRKQQQQLQRLEQRLADLEQQLSQPSQPAPRKRRSSKNSGEDGSANS